MTGDFSSNPEAVKEILITEILKKSKFAACNDYGLGLPGHDRKENVTFTFPTNRDGYKLEQQTLPPRQAFPNGFRFGETISAFPARASQTMEVEREIPVTTKRFFGGTKEVIKKRMVTEQQFCDLSFGEINPNSASPDAQKNAWVLNLNYTQPQKGDWGHRGSLHLDYSIYLPCDLIEQIFQQILIDRNFLYKIIDKLIERDGIRNGIRDSHGWPHEYFDNSFKEWREARDKRTLDLYVHPLGKLDSEVCPERIIKAQK